MAEGLPPPPIAPDEPPATPPPSLSSIRVKGPGGKGLNKPAILIAAGGSVGVVLFLASGAFSPDPSRKPAEARPMMSDPARPEMAQSAIRRLPTTYEEAAQTQAALLPASTPILGPPMAGDMAAFAPVDAGYPANEASWATRTSTTVSNMPQSTDPTLEEALLADRSSIVFDLKYQQPIASTIRRQTSDQSQSPLTALRQPNPDQPPPQASAGSDRALHPGTVIPASLVTAINSETPGPVIAQVTQTIYDSITGRTPLIPQGARLIGDYRSSSRYGQSRVAIIWSRLIMPNGKESDLNEAAVDPSGAAGIKGDVDNHWGEVFGAAALGTIINVGVAATEENPSLTFSGVGATYNYDPVQDALRDGVQRTGSIVTNRVVDRSLAIPPTIRVPAGTKVLVTTSRRMIVDVAG